MPARKKAATFETFEMNIGRTVFYWYVKDAEGNIIDSWSRLKEPRYFASEAEARAWFATEHPTASDLHTYVKE